MKTARLLAALTAATVLGLGLGACERKGPAERAGERIDETVEETGERIEETGEDIRERTER
jgi:hypothetical protein